MRISLNSLSLYRLIVMVMGTWWNGAKSVMAYAPHYRSTAFSTEIPVCDFPSEISFNIQEEKLQILVNDWCFRPRFCTVRLYWAGDNLGE